MNDKLNTLLRQLRDLDKSYEKLIRAVPNPATAERNADNALQAILTSLNDPDIKFRLEPHIDEARAQILENFASFDKEMTNRLEELLAVEVRLS